MQQLKAATSPYPAALRDALIRKFEWEILFAIENGELAAGRAEQTHVAGCAYRALACAAQVLFALNERYLINEKGALQEAAHLPLTIPDIAKRAGRHLAPDRQCRIAGGACRFARDRARREAAHKCEKHGE